ncbi:MAG: ABC transporter ATP-binding protein [Bryobacterales bacterium]|nr:ABC transporter ATP-binding protein [Bryobacteraceae bacterium]MDW8354025.1 ABC transporter ATP-binding protein [Bryobacterales bacterium]
MNLAIYEHEFVSVAGPSGSSKSTLLSILGLLDGPTRGPSYLKGRAVEGLKAAERARLRNREIGFIFQAFNLIGDLTVYEKRGAAPDLPWHAAQGAESPRSGGAGAGRRVPRVRHYPMQLSGGEQQRVAVARAIVGRPSLPLADEPTGNLDSRTGEAVVALLRELPRAGSIICMVTHDPRYADYASRTVRLFEGRIVDDGMGTAM